MNTKSRKRWLRRGSAVVEAAVLAPLMVTAMLGMMEAGYAFMLKQTVSLASREGCRAGALPGGSVEDVHAAVDAAMQSANLCGYTTSTNVGLLGPSDTEVWVEVSIPLNRASWTGTLLGGGTFNITTRTTMRREGVEPDDSGQQGMGV